MSGNALNTAGTLGGFLKEVGNTNQHLLSCYHVLRDGAATAAVQRGRADGGKSSVDDVGQIAYAVPLTVATGFSFQHPYHCVDVATALMSVAGAQPDPLLRILRVVVKYTTPIANISLGDQVIFVGKESDRRDAKVFRFVARTKVEWPQGSGNWYNVGDVCEIEPLQYMYFGHLMMPGDSGSWVVRPRPDRPEHLEAYGMVFAGSGEHALCCFMENVFAELNRVSATNFDYV